MNTGNKELRSILEELAALKLPNMATELEKQYRQPKFHDTGRLELISTIIHAEYTATTEARYASRLKKAKLKGNACTLEQCKDSEERQYQPRDIVETLVSLDFIRSGMNLCILNSRNTSL